MHIRDYGLPAAMYGTYYYIPGIYILFGKVKPGTACFFLLVFSSTSVIGAMPKAGKP